MLVGLCRWCRRFASHLLLRASQPRPTTRIMLFGCILVRSRPRPGSSLLVSRFLCRGVGQFGRRQMFQTSGLRPQGCERRSSLLVAAVVGQILSIHSRRSTPRPATAMPCPELVLLSPSQPSGLPFSPSARLLTCDHRR